MSTPVLINGNFLCRFLTGIERFAREVLKQPDELMTSEDDFSIYIPSNAKIFPEFKKIKPVISDKGIKSFPFLDMGVFARAVKKSRKLALNFLNTAPYVKNCVHYIDAFNTDINLDKLLKEKIRSPEKILEKYTYKQSAEKLLEVCRNIK